MTKEKENKTCPSYDSGFCETYIAPYQAKCKDIPSCIWKDTDFKKKIKSDDKCKNQNVCNPLITVNNQYEKVVEQNRSLQKNLQAAQKQNKNLISLLADIKKECGKIIEDSKADYNNNPYSKARLITAESILKLIKINNLKNDFEFLSGKKGKLNEFEQGIKNEVERLLKESEAE